MQTRRPAGAGAVRFIGNLSELNGMAAAAPQASRTAIPQPSAPTVFIADSLTPTSHHGNASRRCEVQQSRWLGNAGNDRLRNGDKLRTRPIEFAGQIGRQCPEIALEDAVAGVLIRRKVVQRAIDERRDEDISRGIADFR